MVRFLLALMCCLALATAACSGFDAGEAAFKSGEYETALREYRPLAEQGDAGAQVMYHNGLGAHQDFAEAMKWFRLAAEQGA